jgi:hypothetical protein
VRYGWLVKQEQAAFLGVNKIVVRWLKTLRGRTGSHRSVGTGVANQHEKQKRKEKSEYKLLHRTRNVYKDGLIGKYTGSQFWQLTIARKKADEKIFRFNPNLIGRQMHFTSGRNAA